MQKGRLAAVVAAPLAVAMLASACGGGGSSSAEEGWIVTNGTEPENPLVPANTTEAGGGDVLDPMFTGLVEYNEDTSKPQNAVAESIETKDNKVYTIKLKEGWTFHDGSPVEAKNFVDAWNYAAYAPNGQSTASFFEHIEGYDEVSPEDPDGESGPKEAPEPKSKKMSGLEIIDPLTFKVTLKAPFAIFPTTLGYTAFSPMPDSFFKDPEAFEKKPIGNGPFKFDSREANTNIKISRYDKYPGKTPEIKGVEFKIYNELETAYQDLVSGEIDFMNQVPPSALAGDKWKSDLQDRTIKKEILSNNALMLPTYDEKFKDPKVRKAISMAINRKEITQQVFQGSYEPATSWVPSGPIPNYEDGACGEYCKYDPKKAKQLLKDAGGFDGPLTISSNADGGHKEWIEAICGQLKKNLDMKCSFNPVPTFNEFLKMHEEKSHKGPFRFGWLGDYPAAETFLGKIYKTGASSNYMGYSNPEFDKAIAKADQAPNEEEANKLYRKAEEILAEDMPSIPLWNQQAAVGYSDRLDNVKVSFDRQLNLSTVKLKS